MENLNINSLDDIAASSASLEINRINSGSGVQIAIRGIASSPGSLGIEQSVAVMIDGVYFPQGRVINEGLFDTNQVAILKGPQALYFGKNATAGAVSIVTNDPSTLSVTFNDDLGTVPSAFALGFKSGNLNSAPSKHEAVPSASE